MGGAGITALAPAPFVASYIRPAWAVDLTERTERYRFIYGGRWSSKTMTIGSELALELSQKPLTLLCLREFMRTLDESVMEVLAKAISDFGLAAEVRSRDIIYANGSRVRFRGMERNRESIRGFEGANRVWIEEGQDLSHRTWTIADPTFREPGCQIYVTFNPTDESDIASQLAIVDPLDDAIIREVNWYDNPGWTDEADRIRRRFQRRESPEEYDHVWEGKFRVAASGNPFGGDAAITQCIIKELSTEDVVAYGVDEAFSENRTSDYTCVIGLDANMDVAFYERWRDDIPARRHQRIAEIIGDVPTLVDDTAGRGFLSNRLTEIGCASVEGLVFSMQAKEGIILGLATVITDGRLGIPRRVTQPGENGVLLTELRGFTRDEKGRYGPSSERGCDDTVDTLALAVEQFNMPEFRWL